MRIGPQTLFYVSTDAERAAAWPNPGLRTEEAYTRTSPFGPWIYQALGSPGTNVWVAIHIVALLLCVIAMVAWVALTTAREGGRRPQAVRLTVLGPIVGVLLAYIGTYDPFSVLALCFVLFAWRANTRLGLVVAGVFLGVAHAEHGLLAIVALAIVVRWGPSIVPASLQGLHSPLWAVVGVLAGRAALTLLLASSGIDPSEGRVSWITDPALVRMALVGSLNFMPIIVASFFAGLWGVVTLALLQTGRVRHLLVWCGAFVLLAIWAFIALDHTRVFVLTSLPLVLVLTVFVASLPDRQVPLAGIVLVEVLAWVLVPVRVMTSPESLTYVMDMNALDKWIIFTSHLTHGGW
jgi:hypothetical protein